MPKKQKDGRYRAKVTVGGKPIYVSGATKKELEAEKQRAREYYRDGVHPDELTVETYAVAWYKTYKEPFIRSQSTKNNYATMLNKHFIPSFSRRMMSAVSSADLQQWLNAFSGMSKTTIAQAMTVVRGIFGQATADGMINRDPSARLRPPIRADIRKRRALTDDERKAIVNTIDTHPDGLYLAVLYYLGVRRGEALGLKWGDIDFKENLVHIQRDIDFASGGSGGEDAVKTPAAIRSIYIPEHLCSIFRQRRGLPDLFIFHSKDGKPLSKASSERIWISLMMSAGLAEQKSEASKWKHKDIRAEYAPLITPHYLRHNYITMMYEAGIDPMTAMRLAGHADYQTTANIYTHLKHEHLSAAGEKLENAFFQKSCQKVAKAKK